MSAPASAIAVRAAIAPGTVGKPAGRYPTSAARFSAAARSKAADTLLMGAPPARYLPGAPPARRSLVIFPGHVAEPAGGDVHVLVAAPGQVHQQQAVRAELRPELQG